MRKSFVPDVPDMPKDVSRICSKCPIILKEIGVVKARQAEILTKLDDMRKERVSPVESLERRVTALEIKYSELRDGTIARLDNISDFVNSAKTMKDDIEKILAAVSH
jgi:hypothetical protein